MDAAGSPTKKVSNENSESSRIVPIQMVETGETLMPTFTKLEDPQPPPWSTFSKLNKAPEREVPLKMEAEATEVNGGTTGNEARGRERAETPQKTKVRFDLNEEQKLTTERRSEIPAFYNTFRPPACYCPAHYFLHFFAVML